MRRAPGSVVVGLALALAALPSGFAAAQSVNPPAEFEIAPIPDVALLTCDFRYPDRALVDVIQGRELELRVTVQSEIGKPSYGLTAVSQLRDPGDSNPEFVRLLGAIGADDVPDDYQNVRRFDFKLAIDEDAPPKPYDIALTFEAPGVRPVRRIVRLFVGARHSQKFVDATAPSQPVISAGAQSPLSLLIVNRFPSYVLTVRRIKVTSEPPGLIEDLDIKPDKKVFSGDPTRIELTVSGRQSLFRQLSPFDLKPDLKILLWYDDGYRSDIERLPEIPIEFSLGFDARRTSAIALLSVLLGAVLGAWIRVTFTRAPALERKLTMRARIVASVVLGGVFVLLVTVARVEVLAAEGAFRMSLHKPIVTFLIAFLVGLYDPSDLIENLRKRAGLGKAEAPAGQRQ